MSPRAHVGSGTDSSEQDAKVTELRAALGALSGRSLKYCTDTCLRRYLQARNWDVFMSKKMLEDTLKWRDTYKPEEICWREVAHEGETGKVSRANFHDRVGRTVLIMRPGMQNTTPGRGSIRHLVYLVENAILNLPEGQEQMSWLIDFTGLSYKNCVSVKTAREIINILQNHYPGTIALAFLYNPPRIFQGLWKVVKYFLDPQTFQTVKFVYPNDKNSVQLLDSFFDIENLPSELGGKATLKYDHQKFSVLMEKDEERTASFWGIGDKSYNVANGHNKAGVVQEPLHIASPACSGGGYAIGAQA